MLASVMIVASPLTMHWAVYMYVTHTDQLHVHILLTGGLIPASEILDPRPIFGIPTTHFCIIIIVIIHNQRLNIHTVNCIHVISRS